MAHADNTRRILLSLDGSEAADHAFETYLTTLKRDGDEVVLFTCQELGDTLQSFWKTTVLTYDREALADHLRKEEESRKALLKPYGDRLAHARIHFKPVIAVSESPGHSIVSTAQQEDVAIIVMGTRGRGTLRRTFLGSCSDYVIQHSHVPVVVCPRGVRSAPSTPA